MTFIRKKAGMSITNRCYSKTCLQDLKWIIYSVMENSIGSHIVKKAVGPYLFKTDLVWFKTMRPSMLTWNKFLEPEVIFDRKSDMTRFCHVSWLNFQIATQNIVDSCTKKKKYLFHKLFSTGLWTGR